MECDICVPHESKNIFWNVPKYILILLVQSDIVFSYGGTIMKLGYVRVSTVDQNTSRQEVLMNDLGVDEVFIDRISGKNTNRPELQRMMTYARKGDTVICESISRFARNTHDLLDLIEQLKSKDVEFISKKENIDTNTPAGRFMLVLFGAMAELDREYILDRQREGIAIAKKNGVYKGRKRLFNVKFDSVYKIWKSEQITATRAMELAGMTRSTFYRRVAEVEGNHQ